MQNLSSVAIDSALGPQQSSSSSSHRPKHAQQQNGKVKRS